MTLCVALGALVLVGGATGVAAAVLAAGGSWWFTGRLEPASARRRRLALAASVPGAVDLMAACLACGHSPEGALGLVAGAVDEPLATELADQVARLRVGVDPVALWRELAAHPQLGGVGRTVARAVETGASVSEAMGRLAEDLRAAHRAQVEARARSVGVKAAVPLGICLLPAFVLVGVVPLVVGSLAFLRR